LQVIASQNETSRRFSCHVGGQDNGAIILQSKIEWKSPIPHHVMQKCGHDILEKIHISEKLNRSWFVLLRGVAAQQMPIAILSHPFGASQMTVERMSRAIRLPIWINMQHDPRDLAPVSTSASASSNRR
jgi:hypothetical protein